MTVNGGNQINIGENDAVQDGNQTSENSINVTTNSLISAELPFVTFGCIINWLFLSFLNFTASLIYFDCSRDYKTMSYDDFALAFWHPFGPHGKETPNEILQRKQREIDSNGWTLWSFQYRPMITQWYEELSAVANKSVYAFCSDSRHAVDPDREGGQAKAIACEKYRFVGESDLEYRPIPSAISVPHPFRPRKWQASAFVVSRVIYPAGQFERFAVEWFSQTKGPWCQSRLPTRGEYLIRRGGISPIRATRAVLELKPPYLAVVAAPLTGQ